MKRGCTILLVFAFGLYGCGLFTGGKINEYEFQYIQGEVVVSLHPDFSPHDLDDFLGEFNLKWDRHLGNGYVIKVKEGEEKVWIPFLRNQEMIRDAQINKFGYYYQITATEELPKLEGGLLHVLINYGGCNPGHDYTLEYEKTGDDSYDIWLFKETPDQACRAYISDWRSFEVPASVVSAGQVTIISPVDERIRIQ